MTIHSSGNMDPDDIMATDARKPPKQTDADEPISEQEGEIGPGAVAQPGSPGAADLPPEALFEAIKERLASADPTVQETTVNGRRGLATANNVAFLTLVATDMAFRLRGEPQHRAWRLDASKLLDVDPALHEAPESEWVLVRYKHSNAWMDFAADALAWAAAQNG